MIFNLGFGQSCALDHRPHDRFGAAIELAGRGEFHQFFGDDGFGVVAHGEVRVFEITDDAETLEFLRLDTYPFGGKLATFLAEFVDRDFVLVFAMRAILFFDFPLNRQAVAIPAGDVI